MCFDELRVPNWLRHRFHSSATQADHSASLCMSAKWDGKYMLKRIFGRVGWVLVRRESGDLSLGRA